MKVRDLIWELNKLDPETIVVVASDEEGNNFHKLADLGPGFSPNVNEYNVEVYNPQDLIDEPDIKEDYEAGNIDPVIIIWP